MKRNQLFFVVAMMTASAALTGCSSDLQDVQTPQAQLGVGEAETYTVVIEAFKPGEDDVTRAISESGGSLSTTWAAGEKVYGYINDAGEPQDVTLATGDITAGGKQANLRLTFTKTGGFTTSDQITLYYLIPKDNYTDYSGQDGTLAKIASTYDRMKATVEVNAVIPGSDANNLLSTTPASFVRQQAITKFTVKDKDAAALNVKPINIMYNDGTDKTVDVTPASATNVIYVALPATGSSTSYKFEAVSSDSKKYGTTKSVNLVNGKYYTATLTMKRDAQKIELSNLSEGSTDYTGSTISILPIKNAEGNDLTEGTDYTVTYYKKNGENWEVVSDPDDIKKAGDYKVEVVGKGDYEGTVEKEFTVDKTATAEVQTQLASQTIDDGTVINQGTATNIVPSAAFGLTGAQIKGGTVESGSNITVASMTPSGSWASINPSGQLETNGGGIVTVTVTLPDTDDHAAGSVTKTIYVKQSGIGGTITDPETQEIP